MTLIHTPGPWTVTYSPYILADGAELPAWEVIADIKVCDLNENDQPERQQANAQLIAASPDMLAALQAAVQALNTAPRFRVACLDTDSYAIVRMCDRAIRQATGDPV